MTYTLNDIATYVIRKWSNDRPGKLVEINDELEPYIVQFIDENHLRHPGHSVIEDIAAKIYHEVNRQLNELIHEQQRIEHERQRKLQQLYEKAREEILQKIENNKNEIKKDKLLGLKIMEPLTPEMREELYNLYKKLWDQRMEQERMQGAQVLYEKAKNEIMNKARTHKNLATKDKITGLKIMEPLTPEMREELYKYYSDAWNASHKQMTQEERIEKIKEELLRKARTDENEQSSKQIATNSKPENYKRYTTRSSSINSRTNI